MDSSGASKCLEEMLEYAFLPTLIKDLDDAPFEEESFAEYQKSLKESLPLIFDLLQQQQQELMENKKLRSTLVLLCCELIAPDTIYRLDAEHLLKNVSRLLQEQNNVDIDEFAFDYYRSKLKKDEWKRQLGAMYGFEQYLKFSFHGERKMNGSWLQFCLSVALNARDCFESRCKNLGIRIFIIILRHSRPEDISNLNIHSVMYDSVFKDVHFMESEAATEDIWNCLYMSLDYFKDIDSTNWSQVDDMLEVLIRDVPLTSNHGVSVCMLKFIPKLCAYFTLNREEILLQSNLEVDDIKDIEKRFEGCAANTSYTAFRWAKSILNVILFDRYKLMRDIGMCLRLLKAMHQCYMVCILPIPIRLSEPHLLEFFEKFTSSLMEAIVTHKQHDNVIKIAKTFLRTFMWQIENSHHIDRSPELNKFHQAFKRLMQHDLFIK